MGADVTRLRFVVVICALLFLGLPGLVGTASADTGGLVWPTSGTVSWNAASHLNSSERAYAIDIAATGSTNAVVAASSGTVVVSSTGGNALCHSVDASSNGLGNYVMIRHSSAAGTTYTTYAHLASISVPQGANVAQGQPIGILGWSGCVDPAGVGGQHLHFMVSTCDQPFTCSVWRSPDPAPNSTVTVKAPIANSSYAGVPTASAFMITAVRYANGGSAISFNRPTPPTGTSITGYNYRRSCNGGVSVTSSGSTTQVASPLVLAGRCTQGTSNDFQISARYSNGTTSAWSQWVTIGPAIGMPTLNSVAFRDGGSALSFVPPAVPAGVSIRGYVYRRSCNGGLSVSSSGTTTQVVTPLVLAGRCSDGTVNSFQIAAYVDGGYSAWSGWKTIGPAIAAPTLTGAKLVTGGATLTMVAPTVASGTTIRGYLYRRSCNGGLSVSSSGTLGSFTGFSGLASGTCSTGTPSYQIAAFVDGGYSAWSSWRNGAV